MHFISNTKSSNVTPSTWVSRQAAAGETVKHVAMQIIPGISELPVYDMLNGDPENAQPYQLRSTISSVYFWCPVGGIAPEQALMVVNAFIKAHLYNVHANAPTSWDDARKRKTAIILGVTRAAMTASFKLFPENFVAGELAGTHINAVIPEHGAISYQVLVGPAAARGDAPDDLPLVDHTRHLTAALDLTALELKAVKLLVKLGSVIIPIQGHNLLADGYHHFSGAGKAGSRAWAAIEKQVITDADVTDWFGLTEPDMRDILWHRTGDPIKVAIKLGAATSKKVAATLKNMDLGAAAARLPAIESEARPISAFLKCTNMVKPIIEGNGGRVENSIFEDVMRALEAFPIGVASVPDPANPSNTLAIVLNARMNVQWQVTVRSRHEVLDFIQRLIPRVQDKVAVAFGFYTAMVDSSAMSGMGRRAERGCDSLLNAYSLVKLRSECMASYHQGMELYADYRAKKQREQADGRFVAPDLVGAEAVR